ncbi:MAG: hypothetical protein DKT66_06115 [Candidatus Melainabacteria bacterium]|nr:MAG: hypothetical protein DKT66_06115 [Candidatus Melainabacteria bacterium]
MKQLAKSKSSEGVTQTKQRAVDLLPESAEQNTSDSANKYTKALGKVLKARRLEIDLTEKEAATRANCTREFVDEIESGKIGPSVGELLQLAKALYISMSELTRKAERALANKTTMQSLDRSIRRKLAQKKTALKTKEKKKLASLAREETRKKRAEIRAEQVEANRLEKQKARDLKRSEKSKSADGKKKPGWHIVAKDFQSEVAVFPDTKFGLTPTDAQMIEDALQLLSGRWACALLITIANGTIRSTHLLSAVPGLSAKMAAQRLREMQKAGLIKRAYFREVPPRVEYTLTPEGHVAISILEITKEIFEKILR